MARLGLLACLYVAQGLPFGFFTQALPVLMRQERVSLGNIGLTSLLALPWALKFLWAPYIDRYGTRRAWIVPLQLAGALTLCAVAMLDYRTELAWVLAAVLLVNLLASTQDIATDALAVEILDARSRGLGNGVQVAGYRLGMMLGGGVILMLLDRLDWSRAFLLMAGLLVLCSLPVLFFREPPRHQRRPQHSMRSALADYFRQPGAWRWALLLSLYKSFESMAGPMVKPMLVDLGYTLGDVGAILGTAGSLAALAGALAGGAAVVALGRRRALLGFGALQVVTLLAYVLPSLRIGGEATLYAAVVVEHFFGSMATAALFTVMMDACRPGHAATDFTVQACVVVVTTGVTSMLSGYVATPLGYTGHFFVTAGLSLVGLLGVVRLIDRPGEVARRVFASGS